MRRMALAVLCMSIWGEVARADNPPDNHDASGQAAATPPPSPKPTDTTSPDTQEADAKATSAALQTQAQVPTVRGGTLGIPSSFSSEGLQAMVSSQASTKSSDTQVLPGKIGFDLFTRLGGITLFDHFSVDILAESYKQDLPHVDLLTKPALPRMTLTEVRDVGFRARLSSSRDTKVTVIDNSVKQGGNVKANVVGRFFRHHEYTFTLGARFLQRSTPDRDALDFHGASGEAIFHYSISKANEDTVCKIKTIEDINNKLLTAQQASAGRVLAFPSIAIQDIDDDSVNKAQGALQHSIDSLIKIEIDASAKNKIDAAKQRGELESIQAQLEEDRYACKTGGYGITFFAGVSGTMLHTEAKDDGMVITEDPLFKEARLSLGGEVQSSFTGGGSTLLPRVGGYMTLSRGSWKDLFAGPSINRNIHPFQFEGGLYVSGHVIGGFDVLVSFVALKSYGSGGTSFLINVAPAIGALLGGK